MFEATFRVAGDSPYAAATAGTDATITLWCTDHRDLLRVGAGADSLAVDAVRDAVGVAAETTSEGDRLLVTETCLRDTIAGVEAPIADAGCVVVPPITYAGGARVVHVLALDAGDLADAYRALGERFDVDVLEKRERAPSLASRSPVPPDVSLTPRQRAVFTAAYDGGYYEQPRRTTVAEIADGIGIDRRTAGEHLRKAEAKLVDAAVAAGFA
ncbi:helix-turn-helix domain-containing protein [Halocalculus aciditolerans]|uniref:helix-turn-helix domain-containing protein n=1 Tax=Halocalculus aciditolerans TaxID=1383812 RepID=UPI00166A67B1|nr:helix-turn-helix domain-containing protein [Halocalculus aciditolerans]